MARVLCVLVLAFVCGQSAASLVARYDSFLSGLWSSLYGDSTTEWPYVEFNNGSPRQSPVDLITSEARRAHLAPLAIHEPNMVGHQAKLYNSGHTAYVYMNDEAENRPYMKGGPLLDDKYIFEQLHFHWGSEDVWGSEHMIDGEGRSVEIHMVHWNSKYNSFDNASTMDDGLAVLTVFAEGCDVDNSLLTPLHTLLPNISDAKTSAYLDTAEAFKWVHSAFNLNHEYYTYPGSLTTEPYSENVRWILFIEPIKLSYTQLHSFRTLHSEHSSTIADNKRNVQPIHARPVLVSSNILKPNLS